MLVKEATDGTDRSACFSNCNDTTSFWIMSVISFTTHISICILHLELFMWSIWLSNLYLYFIYMQSLAIPFLELMHISLIFLMKYTFRIFIPIVYFPSLYAKHPHTSVNYLIPYLPTYLPNYHNLSSHKLRGLVFPETCFALMAGYLFW